MKSPLLGRQSSRGGSWAAVARDWAEKRAPLRRARRRRDARARPESGAAFAAAACTAAATAFSAAGLGSSSSRSSRSSSLMTKKYILCALALHLGAGAAAGSRLPPLPNTPGAAATQAAQATMAALAGYSSRSPVRLQICIRGEAVEEDGELPVLSLCAQLVAVLGRDDRYHPSKMHFFFDGARAAQQWQAHSASALTRSDVLPSEPGADSEQALRIDDDALLVLVAPCNRNRGRASDEAGKLQSVQRLVCGARHVPIILVNPDLEALLLTQRVGRAVPPMFLSDFEHSFFLATASAKIGYVTAVRHVWGSAWEVYRVQQEHDAVGSAALERTMLAERFENKPRSADALAAFARKRKGEKPRVPGRTLDAAWAAEEGWGIGR